MSISITISVLAILFITLSVVVRKAVEKPQSAFVTKKQPEPVRDRRDDWIKSGLSIDPVGERFAIAFPNQKPFVFGFSDLVAVEIERDGRAVTKTNRGSQAAGAAVGALLLGPAGLLLGGLTGSKRHEEKIKSITLKLYTNHLANPVVGFTFLNSWVGLDANSFGVKAAARNADLWYGRFRAVIHGQEQVRIAVAMGRSARSKEEDISEVACKFADPRVVDDPAENKRRERREQDLLTSIEHRQLRLVSRVGLEPAADDWAATSIIYNTASESAIQDTRSAT